MTLEYLESGRPPRPRWQRLTAVGALIVVALAAGVVWVSAQQRERANTQLAQALSRASSDARAGEAVVLSMLQYSSPAIWSTMVGEDVRAGLRELVQRSAAQVVRTLDASKANADGAFVLPWDSAQREAKAAVLALVDAQRDRFARISADATSIGSVFGSPEPSEETARALLRASGVNVGDGN